APAIWITDGVSKRHHIRGDGDGVGAQRHTAVCTGKGARTCGETLFTVCPCEMAECYGKSSLSVSSISSSNGPHRRGPGIGAERYASIFEGSTLRANRYAVVSAGFAVVTAGQR